MYAVLINIYKYNFNSIAYLMIEYSKKKIKNAVNVLFK